MTNCLRRLASVCVPLTRFACVSVRWSTIRAAVTVAAVTVLTFVSASAQNKLKLKDAYVNEPYSFSFRDAVRGEGDNAVWSVSKGALPGGMALSGGGTLDGTSTSVGEYSFDVKAQAGGADTFGTSVTLRVLPAGFDTGQLDSAGASFATTLPAGVKLKACPTPTPDFALASSTADEETIALTEDAPDDLWTAVNQNTLEITDINKLIQNTLANNPAGAIEPEPLKKGDYAIIHIIKWKPFKPDSDKTDPERELWALYELVENSSGALVWAARKNPDDDQAFDTRIFGSRRVAILLLHLKTPRTWDVKYKIDINRRIPQPLQNAIALGRFIAGAGLADVDCEPAPLRNIWGGRLMRPRHLPSDVIVKLNTVTANNEGQHISQSKEYSNSYVNEGRYHWDVSVGMPVVSIKELEFSSENGVVTAKKKERQNAYGFLNIFPRAVDLNGKSFLTSPHLVLGVPISGKPLDRPVVALGTGLYTKLLKINFFAGVAFNRVREPKTLGAGQAATTGELEADLESRRVKKFVFGINFPVRQFIEAVKGNN